MVTLRRSTAVLLLVTLVSMAAALPAGAASRVGPKQYFTGVINGTDGNTATPIPIQVFCPGPAASGHPLKGQTLAVHQLFPPSSAAGSVGQTGKDARIEVFFNAPPPARFPKTAGAVVFRHYDKPQALPTSVIVPCGGTGTVYFTPIPVVPPSESAAVPVQFESSTN